MTPLAIDLFCGLGGWTEGLLAEGYRVVGFDNEQHVYGSARYPAQLVIQDVLTLHGRQFKDAALIVASPPCQAYSYRAMPWKRAKALPPPSNALFDACFRIQREASEAAGHLVPLVVENVCGAQKWVGRARWHYGSFYLWGDVPALMPLTRRVAKVAGLNWSGSDKPGYKAQAFNSTAEQRLRDNTTSGVGQNPDGRNSGGLCLCLHSETAHELGEMSCGMKDCECRRFRLSHRQISPGWRNKDYDNTAKMQFSNDGIEQGGDWFGAHEQSSISRRHGSKSSARKAASAHIAKIPLVLARHIARAWYP